MPRENLMEWDIVCLCDSLEGILVLVPRSQIIFKPSQEPWRGRTTFKCHTAVQGEERGSQTHYVRARASKCILPLCIEGHGAPDARQTLK